MSKPVYIPLLNVNEPETLIVDINVSVGQYVQPGDALCNLETTKSTEELQADISGYVTGLPWQPGQTANAGDIFCYLAESPDWQAPENEEPQPGAPHQGYVERNAPASEKLQIPPGMHITRPALALAEENHLDLSMLPQDIFITEALVRTTIEKRSLVDQYFKAADSIQPPYDPTAIIVYGGGGHGKAVIELLRAIGSYEVVGVIDDGLPSGQKILGVPLLGGHEVLPVLFNRGIRLAANAVGGIGNVAVRIKVFQKLAVAGFVSPAIVHPTALVEQSACLSAGVQVFPHAYVGSEAKIGFGSIVNTSAVVSHDCFLGEYVNISPGALLAGEVHIEDGVLIGMGTTINLQVRIGARARIGNSATVKSDVPEKGIVRAGTTWPE